MTQHKLLRITSRDRDYAGSSSTSDFVCNFNSSIPQNIKSVIVKQVTIPNIFYNVDNKNRFLTYNIAGSPTTIMVPEGQYSQSEFISVLETAASGIGLTITVNTINKRWLLATTTGVQWLDIVDNAMAEILGIEVGRGTANDVNVFTPSGISSLEGVRNVYISSQSFGESNLIRSNQATIPTLAIVPLTVPFGGIEHYISQHSEIDDIDSPSIGHGKNHQKADIRLLDQDGDVLDMKGHHVTIILKVYF